MLNIERGMIKWQPFDSVFSGKRIKREVLLAKSICQKPILSEDQKINIEKRLITAFYTHENLTIKYYSNGQILTIQSHIKKIDFTFHKIYFDNTLLLFEQIINIL